MNAMRPIGHFLAGTALALALVAGARAADSTNAPPGSLRPAYSSFRIVTERNIFSPKRSGRPSGGTRETRRPPRVDAFALVGTMSYEKGQFAFFDGSSSEFRKTLQRDGSIASFKVVDIRGNSVKLEAQGKPVELRVGAQLRREDDGEWQLSSKSDSLVSSSTSSSTGAASGSGGGESAAGGMSEALKRLLEQRDKETK